MKKKTKISNRRHNNVVSKKTLKTDQYGGGNKLAEKITTNILELLGPSAYYQKQTKVEEEIFMTTMHNFNSIEGLINFQKEKFKSFLDKLKIKSKNDFLSKKNKKLMKKIRRSTRSNELLKGLFNNITVPYPEYLNKINNNISHIKNNIFKDSFFLNIHKILLNKSYYQFIYNEAAEQKILELMFKNNDTLNNMILNNIKYYYRFDQVITNEDEYFKNFKKIPIFRNTKDTNQIKEYILQFINKVMLENKFYNNEKNDLNLKKFLMNIFYEPSIVIEKDLINYLKSIS